METFRRIFKNVTPLHGKPKEPPQGTDNVIVSFWGVVFVAMQIGLNIIPVDGVDGLFTVASPEIL